MSDKVPAGRDCEGCAVRASWIALGVNAALFVLKAGFVYETRSRSLLADALETLANVAITGLVLFSLRVAAKGRDDTHHYGYGKMEFLASAVINFTLLLAAAGFMAAAVWELAVVGPEKPPSLVAAAVAAVSTAGSLIVYAYCACAARHSQSASVLANASVNWADAGTSAAVVLAVVMANLGLPSMDALVGVLIGVWIAKIALDGLEQSVKELLDFSPGAQSARIAELAAGVPGVAAVREVKTRLVGRKLWVDLEVAVAKERALGEGLGIAQSLRQALTRDRTDIADVSVRLAAK
ncbi:MAG: cation diffusion facilitator family transporter [Elusimicrobia bacterium]|nr:cation diffusion facilitator family transporter [Elusimicrobiota bacterium]